MERVRIIANGKPVYGHVDCWPDPTRAEPKPELVDTLVAMQSLTAEQMEALVDLYLAQKREKEG